MSTLVTLSVAVVEQHDQKQLHLFWLMVPEWESTMAEEAWQQMAAAGSREITPSTANTKQGSGGERGEGEGKPQALKPAPPTVTHFLEQGHLTKQYHQPGPRYTNHESVVGGGRHLSFKPPQQVFPSSE